MKKLNKIFSILLTAAIMTSLLVTSAVPVSAADNAWSSVTVPGATGFVMPNDVTGAGPVVKAIDDTLFAYVNSGGWWILKSTNFGNTWSKTSTANAPATITTMAVSPADANVLYYTTWNGIASTLFKSLDKGATWTAIGNLVGNTITAMTIGVYNGKNVVIVGADAGGVGTGNVWFLDESALFFSFQTLGTNTFNNAMGNVIDTITSVAVSPSFGTNRGVIAVGVDNGAANTYVGVDDNGGTWGASFGTVVIPGATTMSDIAFPSDFNMFSAGSMRFFLSLDDAVGVYWFNGGVVSTVQPLTLSLPVASIEVDGPLMSGTVIAGLPGGTVRVSTNGGVSWSGTYTKTQPTGPGPAQIVMKSDFATSGTAGVMTASAASLADDGSGFFKTTDKGVNWNGVSLLNSSINQIVDLGVKSGLTWLLTSGNPAIVTPATPGVAGDSFRLTAGNTGGDSVDLVGAAGGFWATITNLGPVAPQVTITANGSGTAAIVGTTIFLDGGDVANIKAVAPGSGCTVMVWGTAYLGASVLVNTDNDADVLITQHIDLVSLTNTFGVSLPDDTNDSVVVTATVGTTLTAVVTETGSVATTVTGGGPWTVTFGDAGDFVVFTNTDTTLVSGTFTGVTGAPVVSVEVDTDSDVVLAPGTFSLPDWGVTYVPPVYGAPAYNVWRSADNGASWMRLLQSATAWDMLNVLTNGDQLILIDTAGPTLNKSIDNGQTWTAMTGFFPSLPAVNSMVQLDATTFYAGGLDALYKVQGNMVTTIALAGVGTVTSIDLDGTSILVGGTAKVAYSTDSGATFKMVTLPAGATFVDVEFQTAYATSGLFYVTSNLGGLYEYDTSATTPVLAQLDTLKAGAPIYAHKSGIEVLSGVGVVTGIGGPQGMVYVLDADGTLTRVKCRDTQPVANVYAELVSPSGFTSASFIRMDAAAGANKITIVGDGNEIWTYTDTMAVFGTGAAVTSFTMTTAAISWDAIAGATAYDVKIVVGSATPNNPYTATNAAGVTVTVNSTARTATFTGLTANTTYSFNVWAVAPVTSFHTNGVRTFSTQPAAPTTPVGLAPGPAAVDVPVKPSFQWAPVAGATSYELWVDTKADFSTAQKFTSVGSAYAWTATALANNTVYYWQVRAVTGTGTSAWVTSVFTTVAAAPPVVTVTSTTPASTSIVLTVPTQETPSYIWIIIGVGGLLTILVIVLIVRTRRVV